MNTAFGKEGLQMSRVLRKLNDSRFDEVYSIMKTSFNKNERRNYAGQKEVLAHKDYRLYGATNDNNELMAFMATWEPGNFIYLEHFAVDQNCRSGGIGGSMLSDFLKERQLPMILEVELPDTDIAKRRIEFYKRIGLSLNLYGYKQLRLNKDGGEPPYLYFMTYPEAIDEKKFLEYKKYLTEVVYKTGV